MKAKADLATPLNDGQIAFLNAILEEFKIKPLTTATRADLANAKACRAARDRCSDCMTHTRSNCFKYEPKLVDGKVYANKYACNTNRMNQIVNSSQVPKNFAKATLRQIPNDGARHNAISLAEHCLSTNSGLYVYGRTGVGKTMLASAIVVERAKLLRPSIFRSATTLLSEVSFDIDKVERETNLTKFKTCPCLVIDDLGSENVTGWSKSVIFDILDARYKSGSMTIITSNYSVEQLGLKYGEDGDRICRRINELCEVTNIIG